MRENVRDVRIAHLRFQLSAVSSSQPRDVMAVVQIFDWIGLNERLNRENHAELITCIKQVID